MQPGYHQIPGTRGVPARGVPAYQGVPARGRAEREQYHYPRRPPTIVISKGRSYTHIAREKAPRATIGTAILAGLILLGLGIVFAAPPLLIVAAVMLTISVFAIAITVAAENALRDQPRH